MQSAYPTTSKEASLQHSSEHVDAHVRTNAQRRGADEPHADGARDERAGALPLRTGFPCVVDGGDEVEDKLTKRRSSSRVRYSLTVDVGGKGTTSAANWETLLTACVF